MSDPSIYYPEFFIRQTVDDAKSIILMDEGNLTTADRWVAETKWLLSKLQLPRGLTVDFGCGVGRIAKHIVTAGGSVIGIDVSPTMRGMSELEVRDPGHFTAVSPSMARELVIAGLIADAAMAIWALQHVPGWELEQSVNLLADILRVGASLWTLDRDGTRFVPVTQDGIFRWVDDGKSVDDALGVRFDLVEATEVPTDCCVPGASLKRWTRRE